MNEQTAALVSTLAAKLGTTSEYLWAVLLKQAPVYAAISIIEFLLTVAVAAVVLRYRKAIGPKMQEFLDECEVLAFIIYVVVGIFCLVWIICLASSIEKAITSIVNPEYWALKEVLSAVKSK